MANPTIKIGNRVFEKTVDNWTHYLTKNKFIIVMPEVDGWKAEIRKVSKSGKWMDGSKTMEILAESRGRTVRSAVEALPEISEMTAQVKASIKYNEKNVKQIKLALNKSTDADIISALEKCENVQGYIKELIRKDLNK